MTITPGYDLATDAQFRELSNFSTPPRAGRVTAIETSGQVRVETDDPDGGDVLAWPLDGFIYAVNDVVYIAFAVNSPDSAIVIGSLGNLPTINPLMLPFVRVDGTTPLTGDWIAGALRSILIGTLIGSAASGGSLTVRSTSHATKGKVIFGLAGLSAYDEVNERLGIGTNAPTSTIMAVVDGGGAGITSDSYRTNASGGNFLLRHARGSVATPTTLLVNDQLGQFIFQGYNGSNYNMAASLRAHMDAADSTRFEFIVRNAGANIDPAMVLTSVGALAIGLSTVNASILGVKAGNSANDAAVGGLLYATTVQAGNIGVGEDDLASYSVPASTLSADGMSLTFEAFGTFANNLNAKRIRVRFGAAGTTLVFDLGAGNNFSNQYWTLRGRIVRTGAATQKGEGTLVTGVNGGGPGSAASFVATGLSQTLSGAVTLKITGEATANNDVVIESFTVGWDDANT